MKIIDEHTFEGKGYHPFLITDSTVTEAPVLLFLRMQH